MPRDVKYVLALLIIAPIILFTMTTSAAIYYVFTLGKNSQIINNAVTNAIPYILIGNHTILFLLLLWVLKKNQIQLKDISIKYVSARVFIQNSLIGILMGIILFGLSHFVLTPTLTMAGVGSGVFQPTHGFPVYVYMIGSTIFAGIVEEAVYRCYGIGVLEKYYSKDMAIFVTSVLFSVLHFGEGFGGVVNAFILGALLGIIFVWKQNLETVAFAHATINFIGDLISFFL